MREVVTLFFDLVDGMLADCTQVPALLSSGINNRT